MPTSFYSIVRSCNQLFSHIITKLLFTILVCVVSFVYLSIGIAVSISVLAIFTIFNWSSKWLSIIALIALASIPILLYFGVETLAEDLAILVYSILVLVLLLELKNYCIEHIFKNTNLILDTTPKALPFTKPVPTPIQKLTNLLIKQPKIPTQITSITNPTKPILLLKTAVNLKLEQFIWNLFVIIVFALISFLVFNFNGLTYFRDLVSLPYFYNIQAQGINIAFYEKTLFNTLVTQRVKAQLLHNLFWQSTFWIGLCLTYVYTFKLQKLFSKVAIFKPNLLNSFVVFGLTLLFVFNPWTYERFLMGQINVLRGHLIFVPVMYYLLQFLDLIISQNKHQATRMISKVFACTLAITILSLINVHHTFFVYLLGGVSVAFILGRRIMEQLRPTKISKNTKYFSIFSIIMVSGLVILPSFLVSYSHNVLRDNSQKAYYDSQTSTQYQDKVITSFSPKSSLDFQLPVQVLIGGGSWMSPSFIEPENLKNDISLLSLTSYYFNQTLAVIVVTVSLIYLINIYLVADKYHSSLLYPYLLLVPIVVLLCFGYAGNAEVITQWFYKLPFSYVLRESGKFYSLFLSLLLLIISVFYRYQRQYIQKLLVAGIGFMALSNAILFITLPRYTNYLQLPTSMTEVVTKECNVDQKVLFYPFDLYVTTSYLDTFSIYPYTYLTPCNPQLPEKSTSMDESGKSFLLYTDDTSAAIDSATSTFISSKNLDKDYNIYKKTLQSLEIQVVVIDSATHPELEILQNHLDSRLDNISKDQEVYIFKLP